MMAVFLQVTCAMWLVFVQVPARQLDEMTPLPDLRRSSNGGVEIMTKRSNGFPARLLVAVVVFVCSAAIGLAAAGGRPSGGHGARPVAKAASQVGQLLLTFGPTLAFHTDDGLDLPKFRQRQTSVSSNVSYSTAECPSCSGAVAAPRSSHASFR